MWIARKTYDDLRLDYVKANEECKVQAHHYDALMTTLDWLRVRVTQLEMERAQLYKKFMDVDIPVPSIQRPSTTTPLNPMSALPNFNDIGDEEAAKLGIGYNPDGTLTYAGDK